MQAEPFMLFNNILQNSQNMQAEPLMLFNNILQYSLVCNFHVYDVYNSNIFLSIFFHLGLVQIRAVSCDLKVQIKLSAN